MSDNHCLPSLGEDGIFQTCLPPPHNVTENLNRLELQVKSQRYDQSVVYVQCIPKGGRVGLPGTELGKKRAQLWSGKKEKLQTLRFVTQSPLMRDKNQLTGCWRTQKGYSGAGVAQRGLGKHLAGIFRRAKTESKDTTSVTEGRGLLG